MKNEKHDDNNKKTLFIGNKVVDISQDMW